MSARILSRLLSCALVLAIGLSLLAAAFALIAPMVGEPLDTGFTVACTGGGPACEAETNLVDARLSLDRGSLTLPAPSLSATVLRALDVGVTGGFWIALIWLLRRFSREVSNGRPFMPQTTRQLRWTAVLLLAFPVWELARSALWQAIVILRQPDGGVLIHTFAEAPQTGAVRLLPEFSPGFLVAGLVLLVVAQAFSIGVEVQRDSDEVV